MTTSRLLVLTLVPLFAASWVQAEDKTSDVQRARDVLLKSREALNKASAIRYTADLSATGYTQAFVKSTRGQVLVGQKARHEVPRFRLDITMAGQEGQEPKRYEVGCDGDQYFLVDDSKKTVYCDLDPAVLGSNSRAFQRLILREFGDKEAFKDELEAEKIELRDAESVEGEDCHVVFIKNDSPPDVMWWISKKDNLPRRVRRLYHRPEQGDGTTEFTLSQLVVNPPVKEDDFQIKTPDGFTKTDEFAP